MTSIGADALAVPSEISDPINARILAVSEDRISGFVAEPFAEIAAATGLSDDVVIERLRAMLAAGVIRRIRQTLMATNLARGSLVAWQVPEEKLAAAFDYMFQQDPFSGHVVIRSTDDGPSGTTFVGQGSGGSLTYQPPASSGDTGGSTGGGSSGGETGGGTTGGGTTGGGTTGGGLKGVGFTGAVPPPLATSTSLFQSG